MRMYVQTHTSLYVDVAGRTLRRKHISIATATITIQWVGLIKEAELLQLLEFSPAVSV